MESVRRCSRQSAKRQSLTGLTITGSTRTALTHLPILRSPLRLSTSLPPPCRERLWASVLRWAAAGCAVRSLASEIQEAAMRISGLVTAIKGFTHMDQAMVAEPVDLGLSLANTVTVLRAKARQKSAAVAIELEAGLPLVRGFAGELNQIWGNLIDNALDAVEDGGHVEVKASREGERVVVHIIDDGPGIPAPIRERIFDPFFTTKPMGQGTGLGLDIVRRLVRHNDGHNRSRLAAGPDGVPRCHADRRNSERGVCAMNKPVLLIVDDDPQVLAAVRRDLRSRYRENYTVMSAASGQEALNAIRELKSRGDSLAMLICDQRMPGMMGSEVLAKSRADLSAGAARSAHRLLRY